MNTEKDKESQDDCLALCILPCSIRVPSVAKLSTFTPRRRLALTRRPTFACRPGSGRLLWRRSFAAGLGLLLAHQGLARQLDAIVLVDGDHLHLHLVADLAHVVDLADILVVQFADVAQPVAARQDLDEGAEVLDRGYSSFVDLADLDLFGDGLDLEPGRLGPGRVAV
jgi:hypothetical protein